MGKKWEKGTIVKQVRPVTYLINNFQKIFQKHTDQLYAAYTNIEVNNEHFCESNSAIDSKSQVLSTSQNSYWAPPIESNTESSIIRENGATTATSHSNISPTLTPKNSDNQSDVRDLSNSPPVLHRLERIWKPPPYLKGIVEGDEPYKFDILLVSRILWYRRITPSLGCC